MFKPTLFKPVLLQPVLFRPAVFPRRTQIFNLTFKAEQTSPRNGCALRRDISWIHRAVACFPAPFSARSSTGTSLCANSRITAPTARMLGLSPSTNAPVAGRDDRTPPPPQPWQHQAILYPSLALPDIGAFPYPDKLRVLKRARTLPQLPRSRKSNNTLNIMF